MFLFFFQLITEFIEGIYVFGLLGTDIPPEMVCVLFLFSPILLILVGERVSPVWLQASGLVIILARAIEVVLSTRGRMLVAGAGVAAWMVFFPMLLAIPRSGDEREGFRRELTSGLFFAVLASVFLRSVNIGSDLTLYSEWSWLSWLLAIVALILLWRWRLNIRTQSGIAESRKILGHLYVWGIANILLLFYFSFSTPHVMVRWVGIGYLPALAVLLLAWIAWGFWRNVINSGRSEGSTWVNVLWGVIFVLALLFTILPQQVYFPSEAREFPITAPVLPWWQIAPVYVLLALSPFLFSVFEEYLRSLLQVGFTTRSMGSAFLLAAFYMLVMILAQVFTTVYDYIPVIGPFFRDRFWLVFLVLGIGSLLPAFFKKEKPVLSEKSRQRDDWHLGFMAVLAGGALVGAWFAEPHTAVRSDESTFVVFTYNIQQGYSEAGERNFEGQIELIQSVSPDILGLQECDTNRVAGGNADVVGYFADRLGMNYYYGPSPVTGTFGIALLSKYPIENPETYFLFSEGEQVAVIEAEITISSQRYTIFVTHLGNGGPIVQQEELLSLLVGKENVIAMGDFNFRPYEQQYAITIENWVDAYAMGAKSPAPAGFDLTDRIDHVFISPGIKVEDAQYLIQPESDHPALFVQFKQ